MGPNDKRWLDALPPEASEAIAPLLNTSASKWTMAKAASLDAAINKVGCPWDEIALAETLAPPQRALMELIATHPELGLRGGIVYRWPRWSMRRWLGLDPAGALEQLVSGDREGAPLWRSFASSREDPNAIRHLLEELSISERLVVFGELDAGAYALTTKFVIDAQWAVLELPGVEALQNEGRDWAPRHADWLLELAKPDADPFLKYQPLDHPAIRLPLFLSFVRSGVPIERRWEIFLPQCLDRPELFRECVEGMPEDRRASALGAALTTFLALNTLGPNASPIDPAMVLKQLVPLFEKYPPASLMEDLFRRYAAGYHLPKKTILASLADLAKRFPVLAPALRRDPSKKPLKLTVELCALPPQDKLRAIDKERIAKLDESSYPLLEQFEVVDANSDRRYQAILHAGCDGCIFANGTADVVAIIAQEGADGDDAALCEAFDKAFAAQKKGKKRPKKSGKKS